MPRRVHVHIDEPPVLAPLVLEISGVRYVRESALKEAIADYAGVIAATFIAGTLVGGLFVAWVLG